MQNDFVTINGRQRLRRLRILRLEPTFVLAVLADRTELRLGNMPDDMEVVSVNADWASNTIELQVYSNSFDVVPFAERPPIMAMVWEREEASVNFAAKIARVEDEK